MHEKLPELLKNAGLSGGESATDAQTSPVSLSSGAKDSASTSAIEAATQAISQLRQATQGSVDSLTANTDALTQSAQSRSSGGTSGSVIDEASGLFSGGGLGGGILGGGLDLLFKGIASLFGGGSSEPPPLTTYMPPSPQHFELATSNGTTGDAAYDAAGQPREVNVAQMALNSIQPANGTATPSTGSGTGAGQSSPRSNQNITVQVQAMDSRSFLDHSQDIASAVREAMLNMHSINDVVNDL